REVKKTQRRVNALDKMVIPRSREVKRYIESSLEERDRESLFAVKMLKSRLSVREEQ
ncbi:MAG: V-type ATP synthase subunit D, partial [Rectinema sp.]